MKRLFEVMLDKIVAMARECDDLKTALADEKAEHRNSQSELDRLTKRCIQATQDVELAGKLYTAAQKAEEQLYRMIEVSDRLEVGDPMFLKLSDQHRQAIVDIHRALAKSVAASERLTPLPF